MNAIAGGEFWGADSFVWGILAWVCPLSGAGVVARKSYGEEREVKRTYSM
jgi:hypothetical protein